MATPEELHNAKLLVIRAGTVQGLLDMPRAPPTAGWLARPPPGVQSCRTASPTPPNPPSPAAPTLPAIPSSLHVTCSPLIPLRLSLLFLMEISDPAYFVIGSQGLIRLGAVGAGAWCAGRAGIGGELGMSWKERRGQQLCLGQGSAEDPLPTPPPVPSPRLQLIPYGGWGMITDGLTETEKPGLHTRRSRPHGKACAERAGISRVRTAARRATLRCARVSG
ncbi:hypothetical protein SKAU_G00171180 [Synaphobranchus kaupii]|uniref:Uncharacterized protein n=1 Tax=Synaphobranchus kaupii TaxID=118154 RepID=A0A9Q1FKE2_SYNKA|nr:hypothetical protein SKAU_G00171180 [Synaphobranchus kaupii]